MKSAILSVFQNRLITSSNFVSLNLVDTTLKLQLNNTYYVAQGSNPNAAISMYNQTLSELSNFDLFKFDTNYIINLSMITGANIAEPTVTNSLYTIYILLQKSKLSKCFNTQEEATDFLKLVSENINALTADVVERVEGSMVDNTDASHPIINRDKTKLDIESVLVPNSNLLYIGSTLKMSPKNLFTVVKTYRDMNTNEIVEKSMKVTSDILQSTYIENGNSSVLSLNAKEDINVPIIPTPDLVVSPATVNDTAGEVDLSNYKYTVEKEEVDGVYNLTIVANDLPIHTNSQGAKGAWCGLSIPVDSNYVYSMLVNENFYSALNLDTINDKKYIDLYFDASKENKQHLIKIFKDFSLLYVINCILEVTTKE